MRTRGVRQAAVSALAQVDGQAHLQSIVGLTSPAIESDAGVRKAAVDAIQTLCKDAPPSTVDAVLAALEGYRDPPKELPVELLQGLLARLPKDAVWERVETLSRLAGYLMRVGRPGEAATRLNEAIALIDAGPKPTADIDAKSGPREAPGEPVRGAAGWTVTPPPPRHSTPCPPRPRRSSSPHAGRWWMAGCRP